MVGEKSYFVLKHATSEQVFCLEQEGMPPAAESPGSCVKEVGDTTGQESHASLPNSAATLLRERRIHHYETRLEVAEFTIAIAQSVKLWISIIPWGVRVLYGDMPVFSSLRAEEEGLPWPPDPETLLNLDVVSAVERVQVFGPPNQRYVSDTREQDDRCMEGSGHFSEEKKV